MPFDYVQADVDTWTSGYTPQYWPPHEMFTRLAEEAGELAEEMVGEGKGIGQELSDIVFTIACMANAQGVSLDDAWQGYVRERYVTAGKQHQRRITFERSLDDVQQDVKGLVTQVRPPEGMLVDLMSKQGRLAREVNHLYGNKKKKAGEQGQSLGEGLSAILFSVASIANAYAIHLSEEWERVVSEKMYGRDKERYAKRDITS